MPVLSAYLNAVCVMYQWQSNLALYGYLSMTAGYSS